jgi:hypothetical protein
LDNSEPPPVSISQSHSIVQNAIVKEMVYFQAYLSTKTRSHFCRPRQVPAIPVITPPNPAPKFQVFNPRRGKLQIKAERKPKPIYQKPTTAIPAICEKLDPTGEHNMEVSKVLVKNVEELVKAKKEKQIPVSNDKVFPAKRKGRGRPRKQPEVPKTEEQPKPEPKKIAVSLFGSIGKKLNFKIPKKKI